MKSSVRSAAQNSGTERVELILLVVNFSPKSLCYLSILFCVVFLPFFHIYSILVYSIHSKAAVDLNNSNSLISMFCYQQHHFTRIFWFIFFRISHVNFWILLHTTDKSEPSWKQISFLLSRTLSHDLHGTKSRRNLNFIRKIYLPFVSHLPILKKIQIE